MTPLSWRKLGRVFQAGGQRQWMQSHTACPVALPLGGDRIRVYFGTRDNDNHPRVGFVEIDIHNPGQVLAVSEHPVLGPGPEGFFDDNGVYPGTIIADGDRLLLFYMGRSNGDWPPYTMAIGLASSDDGGLHFRCLHHTPVMAKGDHDPFMVSTPWVRREADKWRMWYLSGIGWDLTAGNSIYDIKYAESEDGRCWHRDGTVAIGLGPGETNLASPTILADASGYRMWFCSFVNGDYRLCYAHSLDGLSWIRDDRAVGIGLSESGWDSKGMAYPHAFTHDGVEYLLYSGNVFGKDGIGIAIADERL